MQAQVRVPLVPLQQVVEHVMSSREDVPHIMKNCETHVVLKKRQSRGRRAQFKVVDEQASSIEISTKEARVGEELGIYGCWYDLPFGS